MLNSIYVVINRWYDFGNPEKCNTNNYLLSVSAHVDMNASNYNHFFVSGNFNAESDNNNETDFCRRYN